MSGDGEMAGKKTSGRPKGRRMPKHGEYGYRYGTRHFIVTEGQGLIAQDGDWHLVAVPSRNSDGWHNFKLYLNAKAPKNLFHIAVSKGKVAEKREVKALDEYYPDRKDWVLEQALLYIDGYLPLRREKGRRIVYVNHKGWVPVIKEQK